MVLAVAILRQAEVLVPVQMVRMADQRAVLVVQVLLVQLMA